MFSLQKSSSNCATEQGICKHTDSPDHGKHFGRAGQLEMILERLMLARSIYSKQIPD